MNAGKKKTAGLIAAATALGAAVVVAVFLWKDTGLHDRILAALPQPPADLAAKSETLAGRVTSADRDARSEDGALEAVAELGRLYHANGYREEAEACWKLLHEQQSRVARWPYYLASLRLITGDIEAVRALLAETVRLAPDYATGWLKLADLEFKTGKPGDAEGHYKKRLGLVAADPYARLGLARIELQRGNREAAREWIEEIVRDTPEFPTAHNLYSEMLAAEGREDEAFRHRNLGRETGRFREAEDPWLDELDEYCLDPKRLALLGTMAYQTKREDKAIALLERAARLAPGDVTTLEMLGTLYLQVGQPGKAGPVFENILRLSDAGGRRALVTTKLADSLQMQRRHEEALRLVREELARAPASFELHNQLGSVFADLDRLSDAVEAYRNAVELSPNDADSNFSLGSGLLALGRRDEGVRHLKQSLTLQPTYPRTLLLLGRLALEEDRLDDALGYLQPLYESHPEQAMARQLLAQYHLKAGEAASRAGDIAAAERHFREGLKVEPDHADLNANLGVLCLMQGRIPDALAPFEAFHRLRPEDPQSALFLGQLYAQLGRFPEARRVLTRGLEFAERSGNTTTANHCREILRHLPSETAIPSRGGG